VAELKTQPNEGDVDAFLDTIEDETKREDARRLRALMADATGEQPTMWGTTIVGFGSYHYRYATGREGDWFVAGFAPRKQNLTLYIMDGFDEYEPLLSRLGKHSTAKSCLYVKRLADLDMDVLRDLVERSARQVSAGGQSTD
jgi:hypothetical protein